MVRFFCDRCDIEVEGQADLTPFTGEVGDGITYSGWRLRRELCQKCLDEVKDIVTKHFAKPAAKPRRA